MPNIQSAIKRTKTNEKRRQQRMAQKSAIRTSVKKFLVAVENQEKETAGSLLRKPSESWTKE